MLETCNLCHSPKAKLLFISGETHGRHEINKKTHNLFKCSNCGVFFKKLNGGDKLYDLYNNAYFFPKHNKFRSLADYLIKTTEDFSFKRKENFILKHFKKEIKNRKISILDVGCGRGKFLNNINNIFFKKTGFDIENFIDKHDFDFVSGDFLKTRFQGKFDVICFWHVFEHLDKPYEYLSYAKKLLQKDGIIIISTPNTESMGFKFGQKSWFHLDTPRHLFLYNKASLNYILNRTGFAVNEIKNEYYDYYTDLFWSFRKSKLKYLVYFFYPLIKLFSKETMTLICKIQ